MSSAPGGFPFSSSSSLHFIMNILSIHTIYRGYKGTNLERNVYKNDIRVYIVESPAGYIQGAIHI